MFLLIVRVTFVPSKSIEHLESTLIRVKFKPELSKKLGRKVSSLSCWVGFNKNIK